MKKNFAVNIGFRLFNIDEDAYEILKNYLEKLRRSMSDETSIDEIISDIEGRIAELLDERLAGRSIVVLEDIRYVIDEMGAPEEIDEKAGQKNEKKVENEGPRRLFRDPENRLLGGVCSGLGAFFNVDPLWIRLGFVILVLLMGSGILVYLALWILVPLADTAAERLQMRGKKVNASNIADNIRTEFEEVKTCFRKKGKSVSSEINQPHIRHGISEAGWVIIQIIRILAGVFFVGISLSIIIAFVFALFFKGLFSWHHAFNLFDFLSAWTNSPVVAILMMVSGILIILLPLLGLLFGGIRMMLNLKSPGRVFRIIMLSLWSFGIAMGIFLTIYLALNIEKPRKSVETVEFATSRKMIAMDAYNIEMVELDNWGEYGDDDISWEKGQTPTLYLHPKFRFVSSSSRNVSIRVESKELRLNKDLSAFSLKKYIIMEGDSTIRFPAVVPVAMGGKNNIPGNLRFTIYIPSGTSVNISPNFAKVLYYNDDEALPRMTEGIYNLSDEGHWISDTATMLPVVKKDSVKMVGTSKSAK